MMTLDHATARELLIEAAEKVRDSVAHQLQELDYQVKLMEKGELIAPVPAKSPRARRTPLDTEEMIRCAEYMLSTFRSMPFNTRTDLLMKYSIDLAVAAEREGKK